MSMTFDAIVIGAGANGLVAAAALARQGMRVQLLERAATTAGQAGTIQFAPGFRAAPFALDAGFVAPAVVSDVGLDRAALDRTYPEIGYSVVVDDGMLVLPRSPARAADSIRRWSATDAGRWPAFAERLHELAALLEKLYVLPAPDVETTSAREALPLIGIARRFRKLGRSAMTEFLRTLPMSVAQLAEEWFESEALRAAVAANGVQDIRHGPRAGGTGFVLLHHLVGASSSGTLRGRGVWRARPDAFAAAAEESARRHGVVITTGANVARILVRDDAVAGIALDNGDEAFAPRVLSAADPARTLLRMVDPVWLDPELLLALRNVRFRGCTAFVLYALDALPELRANGVSSADALRGAVSLSADVNALERAADALKYGSVPERPHIELSAPTLHWPALAPEGRHVLVARVHYAPYRLRDDAQWDRQRTAALTETVTRAIDDVAPGFSSRVLQRATLTPLDVEERFGVTEGAATHGELGLDQILFMRPVPALARYATPVDGLYLCGAGTHPGPGVPGGPGLLAARRVLADTR